MIPLCKDPVGFQLCLMAAAAGIEGSAPKHVVHAGVAAALECWLHFCRARPESA